MKNTAVWGIWVNWASLSSKVLQNPHRSRDNKMGKSFPGWEGNYIPCSACLSEILELNRKLSHLISTEGNLEPNKLWTQMLLVHKVDLRNISRTFGICLIWVTSLPAAIVMLESIFFNSIDPMIKAPTCSPIACEIKWWLSRRLQDQPLSDSTRSTSFGPLTTSHYVPRHDNAFELGLCSLDSSQRFPTEVFSAFRYYAMQTFHPST